MAKKKIKEQIKYKWVKQNIIVVLVCLALSCGLSVGYAILSQNLGIEGEIILRAEKDIRITSIESNTALSCGYDVFEKKYDVDSITVNLDLPQLTCFIEYTVTILNKGTKPMEITRIVDDVYNNNNIIYTIDGLKIEDVIEPEEDVEFTIRFKYKNGITLPTNTELGAIIKFEWDEYIPDAVVEWPDEFFFTQAFLQSGSTFLSTQGATITVTNGGDNTNGSAGLKILGSPNISWGEADQLYSNYLRWYADVDLTKYKKLTFWARQVTVYGVLGVWVDGQKASFYGGASMCSNAPPLAFCPFNWYGWHNQTTWKYFEIDVSQYTGIHTLALQGGCTERGLLNAQTDYSDIRLTTAQ